MKRMRPPCRIGFTAFAPRGEPYSVAAWLADVAPLIEAARAGGPPLVIIGGTGLYFKALLEGLSPVPEIPEPVRRHWRAEAAAKRQRARCMPMLRERDPAMAARLAPSDPQRIVRALEVLEATGRSLLDWQAVAGEAAAGGGGGRSGSMSARRARCFTPAATRGSTGWSRPARWRKSGGLQALGLDPALPAMRALGVRPLLGVS